MKTKIATVKRRKMTVRHAIAFIEGMRAEHERIANAPSNIRIASNRDRQIVQAVRRGRVFAYDDVLKILSEVK